MGKFLENSNRQILARIVSVGRSGAQLQLLVAAPDHARESLTVQYALPTRMVCVSEPSRKNILGEKIRLSEGGRKMKRTSQYAQPQGFVILVRRLRRACPPLYPLCLHRRPRPKTCLEPDPKLRDVSPGRMMLHRKVLDYAAPYAERARKTKNPESHFFPPPRAAARTPRSRRKAHQASPPKPKTDDRRILAQGVCSMTYSRPPKGLRGP